MTMSAHQPVRSANLASTAYDREREILEVRFHSGATWQYAGVPERIHDQMRAATSPGGFFAARIRNAFPAERVA
jgi:hypothetical protein